MAEIVVMNAWRAEHKGRRPQPPSRMPEARDAAVLLFTGVRYERREEMSHRLMDELTLRADSQ
ncbi:hypothetical protein SAMN05880590_101376 [Rhizobium sp. RU35A]|uniref:Uncharacterized protein n=1 Tax=Rhizobium straminoryzae TaxID=1387186 RepID=A0A549T2Y6_9HYPH|nr:MULTISPECIES: hypothetical protein [Rhizobium]TRL36249.1 hypothetical protein FNA46_18410 [Rhizobium straminoryzae]SIP94783.1 hypothetical protein SAMN05880590_101376 [Rhizobium sp. RU35A]